MLVNHQDKGVGDSDEVIELMSKTNWWSEYYCIIQQLEGCASEGVFQKEENG